jgi:hypothetical protein
MILIFFNKINAGQFAMSHGSYDLNLGSKRFILVGDIRSRSWPNIGDSYGNLNHIKAERPNQGTTRTHAMVFMLF